MTRLSKRISRRKTCSPHKQGFQEKSRNTPTSNTPSNDDKLQTHRSFISTTWPNLRTGHLGRRSPHARSRQHKRIKAKWISRVASASNFGTCILRIRQRVHLITFGERRHVNVSCWVWVPGSSCVSERSTQRSHSSNKRGSGRNNLNSP